MDSDLKAKLIKLGSTGLTVSQIALGTVKIGRNKKVKYSSDYPLPSDQHVQELFENAHELGINLIDTAPAYGLSETRIGNLPRSLKDKFNIFTKVGEKFDNDTGISEYDFSALSIEESVYNSLEVLRLDYLPAVLVHCDKNDLICLKESPVLETLFSLKDKGLIKSIGASTMSLEGGLYAVEHLDIVMVSYNPEYKLELPVIQKAQELGKGVLLKKALMSGNIHTNLIDIFATIKQDCNDAVIVTGTLNIDHLQENVLASLGVN